MVVVTRLNAKGVEEMEGLWLNIPFACSDLGIQRTQLSSPEVQTDYDTKKVMGYIRKWETATTVYYFYCSERG